MSDVLSALAHILAGEAAIQGLATFSTPAVVAGLAILVCLCYVLCDAYKRRNSDHPRG